MKGAGGRQNPDSSPHVQFSNTKEQRAKMQFNFFLFFFKKNELIFFWLRGRCSYKFYAYADDVDHQSHIWSFTCSAETLYPAWLLSPLTNNWWTQKSNIIWKQLPSKFLDFHAIQLLFSHLKTLSYWWEFKRRDI